MQYAALKLAEESARGSKYLEVSSNSSKLLHECCVDVLVTAFKDTILAECPQMIRNNDTKRLHLMFTLMRNVPNGVGESIGCSVFCSSTGYNLSTILLKQVMFVRRFKLIAS